MCDMYAPCFMTIWLLFQRPNKALPRALADPAILKGRPTGGKAARVIDTGTSERARNARRALSIGLPLYIETLLHDHRRNQHGKGRDDMPVYQNASAIMGKAYMSR